MSYQKVAPSNLVTVRDLGDQDFGDLNPFWGLSDGRFNWEGNPFLEPELTDSYELGYLKEFKSGNIYIGSYYRHTEDEIERIFDVNDAGYSVFKPINLGYTNAYGIEINGSIEFSKNSGLQVLLTSLTLRQREIIKKSKLLL